MKIIKVMKNVNIFKKKKFFMKKDSVLGKTLILVFLFCITSILTGASCSTSESYRVGIVFGNHSNSPAIKEILNNPEYEQFSKDLVSSISKICKNIKTSSEIEKVNALKNIWKF